jgi:hypothetical protein
MRRSRSPLEIDALLTVASISPGATGIEEDEDA